MKRIGIVGSRKRHEAEDFSAVHDTFFRHYRPGDIIVSGGCPTGADAFAEIIALRYKIPITIHKPNLAKLDKKLAAINPRAAYAVINYARNTLIAQDSDILIACVRRDRKGGTEDTIKKFLKIKLGCYLYLC